MSAGTKAAATKRNNVISIRKKQEEKARGRKVTLIEVMHDAVVALVKNTGTAQVFEVVKWVWKRYPDQWAESTIRSYMASYARPRLFERTQRGQYKSYRNAVPATKSSVA